MRGEVIDYAAGSGLISGEDGARYTFTDEQLARREGLAVGSKVDFVPEGGIATQIYPLAAAGRSFESTNEDLSVWEYFRKCMRLYANGEGRARRKEYWSFVLFSALLSTAAAIVLMIPLTMLAVALESTGDGAMGTMSPVHWLIILSVLAIIIVFMIPSYAVLARRLHDVGMSGWFALISLIPYLGGLFVLVIALIPSQEGANAYGPYPKPRAPYRV
jgi:uncharacterized membrane protein YhaH (DUF805 family)